MVNGIILALIAQIIIGISLVVDKIFLKEKLEGNVFTYVFWIGLFNFFAIFVLPFDFNGLNTLAVLTAVGAGTFFLLALIFYYQALQNGEASHTLALLGGFTPLATFLVGWYFLNSKLSIIELILFSILTIGGFVMFLADRTKFKKTILWIALASLCFALVNVLQKISYNNTGFLTSFGIMKFATFLTAMALLISPSWRKQIFNRTKATTKKNKALYLSNRAMTGAASVMLSYAIKLQHPALIEATSGLKYVIIFVFTLALAIWWPKILRENFRLGTLVAKIFATILIVLAISALMFQTYYQEKPKIELTDIKWGVTFSQKMSTSFNMDWRENYLAIINDLKPKTIRLVAYWDLIEPKSGQFYYDDLDWQVDQAEYMKIPVVITIGQKVPRWPECHFPSWVPTKNKKLREEAVLKYEKAVVERYRYKQNLLYWQVENEPHLSFGTCPKSDSGFVSREITLVKQLDIKHEILLTDGGEWGRWYRQVKNGDIFGTTLYRKVYKNNVGSINPPLSPEYYEFKRILSSRIASKSNHPFIISELGLEPWWNKQIYELPIDFQKKIFSNKEFDKFTDFARRTNFDTVYMWGAEWWYYMKINNDDSYWQQAKTLIENGR